MSSRNQSYQMSRCSVAISFNRWFDSYIIHSQERSITHGITCGDAVKAARIHMIPSLPGGISTADP